MVIFVQVNKCYIRQRKIETIHTKHNIHTYILTIKWYLKIFGQFQKNITKISLYESGRVRSL